MTYDLNQIADPKRFQRLLNAILTARFGENVRLTPLQGPDGGSDGETAPNNPFLEVAWSNCSGSPVGSRTARPRTGRYLFQAKYHRTSDHRLTDLRGLVVREFERDLKNSVLGRRDRHDVTNFFLVTNVPSSKESIAKVDEVRSRLLGNRPRLHADIWWGEQITADLDRLPEAWIAFPEIFPGGVPPMLAQTVLQSTRGVARAFKLSALRQYEQDSVVNFRQVKLEQNLFDLFVDLDAEVHHDPEEVFGPSILGSVNRPFGRGAVTGSFERVTGRPVPQTALELLINDESPLQRIVLEGGPGQGKSTVTQMAAQVFRRKLIGKNKATLRDQEWGMISDLRFPFRIELKRFAAWLSERDHGAIDEYIAQLTSRDSGGTSVKVEDVQTYVEKSSIILLLDGLDEIGSDDLRDRVVDAVMDTIRRFEDGLGVDLRVVLTTRPPALAGRRDRLDGFTRVVLTPMTEKRIDDYLARWLSAQIKGADDHKRIREAFEARRHDPHVDALARNPMQLSVLLQFIHLKGDAFPDRRAELYREYFQIAIDRDVEKSPELRDNRELVDGLHAFLGFQFHGMTEVDQGSRSLNRQDIVRLARRWLEAEGHAGDMAARFFTLGEERFGLIVAVSGEGEETTYGFEVQPIQEYFAASYISNRLPDGMAHKIFQELIYRNYWREVGLFLGGLRRPNEKADLLVRARAADKSHSRGWQQSGRAMVLQLLREGVLLQPGHVRTEAIDFVADLLDVEEFRVQRTPEALVETICRLGRAYGDDALTGRIQALAARYLNSIDVYAIHSIFRVASILLPEMQYVELALAYSGSDSGIRSLVRMSLPYDRESTVNMEEFSSHPAYWADVPVADWARCFWYAAIQRGVVLDLVCPEEMHFRLAVEFVTDCRPSRDGEVRALDIKSRHPLAIWKLQQNLQMMRGDLQREADASGDETTRGRKVDEGRGHGIDDSSLDYRFLEDELAQCIRDLITASSGMIASWSRDDDADRKRAISKYVEAIRVHLEDPGISGWVACRCAVEFLERLPRSLRIELEQGPLDEMLGLVEELYGANEGLRKSRHVLHRFQYSMPTEVRLARGKPTTPLVRIVVESIRGQLVGHRGRVASWVEHMALPSLILKPLVEECGEDLEALLRFLGDRPVLGIMSRSRLRVQDTRRVLKICRETGEEGVLRGAACVLVNAAFGRVAKAGVVLKILSAGPTGLILFQMFRNVGESAGKGRQSMSESYSDLSNDVARDILRYPMRFPSWVVQRAAEFVAESDALKNTPLFEEWPTLA